MGNLNNVDQNGKVNPKPGDDPGANIETVIPEPEKNDRSANEKSDAPENTAIKASESNKGSDPADIETVTPDE